MPSRHAADTKDVLPEREERTFWIDGGVCGPLSRAGGTGCEVAVDGGWLLPYLVDVHTHPGAEAPGSPFDQTLPRRQLTERAAGPGLEDGAPADVIAYESVPTTEVDALPHPSRTLLRGRILR